MYIFSVVLGVSVILLWFVGIIGMVFPRVGHRIFGWHRVTKTTSFDGCSAHGTCTICGKECLQDSQGNWD